MREPYLVSFPWYRQTPYPNTSISPRKSMSINLVILGISENLAILEMRIYKLTLLFMYVFMFRLSTYMLFLFVIDFLFLQRSLLLQATSYLVSHVMFTIGSGQSPDKFVEDLFFVRDDYIVILRFVFNEAYHVVCLSVETYRSHHSICFLNSHVFTVANIVILRDMCKRYPQTTILALDSLTFFIMSCWWLTLCVVIVLCALGSKLY